MRHRTKLKVRGIVFRLVVLAASLFCIISCDVAKESLKQKNDIQTRAVKTTVEKIQGGTIVTDITPENQRKRDDNGRIIDTVYSVQKEQITNTIRYLPDGRVTVQTDCPDGEKTTKEENTSSDNSITKEKEKTETFNPMFILYIMIGLAVIVIILMVSLMVYVKNTLGK